LTAPASSDRQSVAGIILAAGESSRMGFDKALLPLGQSNFVEHIAGVLDGDVAPLLAVLGHHADEIERQAKLPSSARVLRNPEHRSGQLSSLHVALRHLQAQPVSGALVCLVDHPAISRQVVRALLARFRDTDAKILIPAFRGRRGHPVLFASSLFEELLNTPLDVGARAVVRAHAGEIEQVEVNDEGVLWDVDRPEDYEALLQRWALLRGTPSFGEPS
jgi:molybdenum cofactor cytidylyltransferase